MSKKVSNMDNKNKNITIFENFVVCKLTWRLAGWRETNSGNSSITTTNHEYRCALSIQVRSAEWDGGASRRYVWRRCRGDRGAAAALHPCVCCRSNDLRRLRWHHSWSSGLVCYSSLIAGWPPVWKTWKCQGIWQLSGNLIKIREMLGEKSCPEKLPKTVYCKLHICVHSCSLCCVKY